MLTCFYDVIASITLYSIIKVCLHIIQYLFCIPLTTGFFLVSNTTTFLIRSAPILHLLCLAGDVPTTTILAIVATNRAIAGLPENHRLIVADKTLGLMIAFKDQLRTTATATKHVTLFGTLKA